MPVSLSNMVRTTGAKQQAEAPAPPPARPPRRLQRVTVLLYPEEIAEADLLWEAQGFKSRHHFFQWLILAGTKAVRLGILKPERRLSRVVEVLKP